jgi:predicted XRE-type DNA-binding protein
LGFSKEKSAELILKSSLLQALQEAIKGRRWKEAKAAAHLGIDRAELSQVARGQVRSFSIERPCF